MLHECVLVLAKYPALLIASYAASASGRQCTRRCTIFRIETINSMLWRAKFLPTFGASLGSTRRFQIEQNRDDCCIDGTWFVGKGSARWKRNPSTALPSCNGRVSHLELRKCNCHLGDGIHAWETKQLLGRCSLRCYKISVTYSWMVYVFIDVLFEPHPTISSIHISPVAAGMPRGIGMIWTSTPVAAAMTRRLKNYGERRNLC